MPRETGGVPVPVLVAGAWISNPVHLLTLPLQLQLILQTVATPAADCLSLFVCAPLSLSLCDTLGS